MRFFKKLVDSVKTDIFNENPKALLTEPEDGFSMDALNSVMISLIEADCLQTDSKVGGIPYMPLDFDYPMDLRAERKGEALAFLCQINFSQLPPLAGFPEYGILQFFIGTDFMFGLDAENPTEQSGFRVIYHEHICDESHLLKELPIHPDFDGEAPVKNELKMAFTPEVSVIGWQDFRYDTNLLAAYQKEYPMTQSVDDIPSEIRDKMEELCNASGSRIGGFPMFTQSDPRQNDNKYANFTTLLIQLDSDPKKGLMWGDDGVCNFFISPEKLMKKDFSEVLYNWDCY
ncbi:MAG: DUF1963 domain-containing protein [Bacteroidales bacterium]